MQMLFQARTPDYREALAFFKAHLTPGMTITYTEDKEYVITSEWEEDQGDE